MTFRANLKTLYRAIVAPDSFGAAVLLGNLRAADSMELLAFRSSGRNTRPLKAIAPTIERRIFCTEPTRIELDLDAGNGFSIRAKQRRSPRAASRPPHNSR